MKRRTPDRSRKVVPIAEAAERRRGKVAREKLHDIADAVEGLAGDPDAPAHFTMLGNMALLEGAFEEAIEAFSRTLSLAPEDLSALAGRGRARAAMDEHALALADYDRAAALAPDQARYHLGRANALGRLGRMAEAVAATTRAIEADPLSAGAHYTRAVYRSHLDDDDDQGVKADLDRTVELAPDEPLYREKRADYLFDMEEYDLAIVDLDRAIALEPGKAQLHYLRGKCAHESRSARRDGVRVRLTDQEAHQRCDAAVASLERALELAPTEGELRGDILWALVCVRETIGEPKAHLEAIDAALAVLPEEDWPMLLPIREQVKRRLDDAGGGPA
jgi:tetratricopeptide (TPR) repeat protein